MVTFHLLIKELIKEITRQVSNRVKTVILNEKEVKVFPFLYRRLSRDRNQIPTTALYY
jgi:hypothetical protein